MECPLNMSDVIDSTVIGRRENNNPSVLEHFANNVIFFFFYIKLNLF